MQRTMYYKKTLSPLVWLACSFAAAQPNDNFAGPSRLVPVINEIRQPLGDGYVTIQTFQYGDKTDLAFVNLHDNETTAVNATREVLADSGGFLLKLDNNGKRNISFTLKGESFSFDPNRVFSKQGIRLSLLRFGRYTGSAADEIDRLAKKILGLIPADAACIIALHNNSNANFSVRSYLPGQENDRDAKLVNIQRNQDADDFFLTTHKKIYSRLAAAKYNIVLQDNDKATQDGSLSVYCGEQSLTYLNCETEHGKPDRYREMILAAMATIRELNIER